MSFAISCYAKPVQYKSMLEIRNIQTHYFDTPDTFLVMKAVINTLQDNGFIIQNIEPELGYIRAKKEVRLKRTKKSRVTLYSTCVALDTFSMVFGNVLATYDLYVNSMRLSNELALHPVIFDSNVDIERVGKRVKVRFSVIEKELENADGYTTVKSAPRKVVRHYEPELYQEFFKQLDKNIFIEKI
jgi:hypothetical protein